MRKPSSTQLLYLLLAFFVVLTPFLSAGCGGGSGGSLLPGSQDASSGLNLKLSLKQTDTLQTQSTDITKLVVKLSSSGYATLERTFAITTSSGTATIGNIPPAMGISLEVAAYCRQNTLKYTGSKRVDFIAGEITEVYLKLDPYTASSLITDSNLRSVIKTKLGLGTNDTITSSHLASMSELDAPSSEINVLTGLNYATNLESLNLKNNNIQDISSLSQLSSLTSLLLQMNDISSISTVANLGSLQTLNLYENSSLSDISALGNLQSLIWLNLGKTSITDIEALADNSYLSGSGVTIYVTETGLSKDDYQEIKQLEGRYVNLYHDVSGFKETDDFTDGDYDNDPTWEEQYSQTGGSDTISVSSGKLVIQSYSPGGAFLKIGSATWSDYSIQSEVTLSDIDDTAGVVMGLGDTNQQTNAPSQFAVFYHCGEAKKLAIRYLIGTSTELLTSVDASPVTANTSFTLKLEHKNDALVGYYNGVEKVRKDGIYSSLEGKAGLGAYQSSYQVSYGLPSSGTFDNVIIENND